MKTSTAVPEPCPFCDFSGADILLRLDESRRIVTCRSCALSRTSPVPGTSYTEQADYFDFHLANERQFRSYAKPQISFVRQYAPQGALLDIGCGVGFLLEEARLQGYRVAGIELNRKAAAYCSSKGLDVKNCTLSLCGFPESSFDIIIMSHVLEHVLELDPFLSEVRTILRPGGILILSQPCHRGWVPRLLRRHWYGWVPDDHIWHFTPETLSPVLAKHFFEIAGVQINSMHHGFGLNMATLLCAPLLARIAHYAGQGDQFYLAARKKG